MKKLISFITLLAIISQFAVTAHGAEIPDPVWYDDFSGFEEGYDVCESFPGVGTIKNNGDQRGNYFQFDGSKITDPAYNSEVVYSLKNLGATEYLTIVFDYKIQTGNTEGAHFYCGNSVQIELDTSPRGYQNIDETEKVHQTYTAVGSITAGEWHEITTVIKIPTQKFDMYVDGTQIIKDGPFRRFAHVPNVNGANITLEKNGYTKKQFAIDNVRAYKAELHPANRNEYFEEITTLAEKPLIKLEDPGATVREALPDAYAMFEGYTYGYSAGAYESVSDDKYLAPVLYDGTLFAPASYVAKALGGEFVDDGTIRVGEYAYKFVEGETSDICKEPPVIVGDELYVPVTNELAQYFGSKAFVDDRGLAIIGIDETPGEQVIRSLFFELRNYSAIFGKGVKSEILFCSRSMYSDRPDTKGGYSSFDATKRFMSTSNRWTYHDNLSNIKKFRDLGSIVQSGLNARPTTVSETDPQVFNPIKGTYQSRYVAAVLNFDGSYYFRGDGLDGWGCTNNPIFLTDLIEKAEKGIDQGQYLWQFDDHPLNSNHRCYCDYCITGFTKWLKEEKNYTTFADLKTNYGAIISDDELNTPIDEFNYKTYLTNNEGVTTNAAANALYNKQRMGLAYYQFARQKVVEFHEKLRQAMDEYAASKGLKIYMSCNTSDAPNSIKTSCWLFNVMDGGMGETKPQNTGADGIFASKLQEQAFDKSYVNSPWVYHGKTTMQLWQSAIPLMYATGQFGLVPWDDWVYDVARFFCTLEELGGNYAFVREYPELFDNYETPEEVGYLMDLGNGTGTVGNAALKDYALQIGKRGVTSRIVAKRTAEQPYHSIDAEDLKGLKALVLVNNISLSAEEKAAVEATGLPTVKYTYSATNQYGRPDAVESVYWGARIKDMPDNLYAVLRTNKIYKNAPVIVHAVSFNTVLQKNVKVEINASQLPKSESYTVRAYSPQKNPYIIEGTHAAKDGIVTVTIPELDNWTVLEISGDTTESIARFDVEGMSGMGLGSRVSYDSAKGTADNFTITTYGEGINVHTTGDINAGQDEAGYVYKRLDGDDVEIVAEVEQINGESGIMLREDVHSNAASITLSYSASKGLRFGKRDKTNIAYTFVSDENVTSMPAYLKLTLKNSVVSAYISNNGSSFTKVASANVYSDYNVAGAFAASADGTKTTCNVRNLSITETNHVIENDIKVLNLFEGRNPGFLSSTLLNYSLGFDGIWDSDLEGSTTDQYTIRTYIDKDGRTQRYTPDGTTAVASRVIDKSPDGDDVFLKLTERGNGDEGLWYRWLPIENGKTYEISCFAKVDPGVTDTAEIVVQTPITDSKYARYYTGTATFTVDRTSSVQLTDEWQRVYIRFTVSDDGIVNGIDARFKTTTNADVYLDFFEMREIMSIGDNINAAFIDYNRYSTLELSSKDGAEQKIRYFAVVRKYDELGVQRDVSIDSKMLTLTGETERVTINLEKIGDVAEIYLWDAETNTPINRTFKVRKTRN